MTKFSKRSGHARVVMHAIMSFEMSAMGLEKFISAAGDRFFGPSGKIHLVVPKTRHEAEHWFSMQSRMGIIFSIE